MGKQGNSMIKKLHYRCRDRGRAEGAVLRLPLSKNNNGKII
jgi:hypothetical protein